MLNTTKNKTKIALNGINNIVDFKFRNQKKKLIKTMKLKRSFSGITLNLGKDKLLV